MLALVLASVVAARFEGQGIFAFTMSALVEQSGTAVCNRAAASWSGILVASPIQRKNSARGRLTPGEIR